MHDMGTHTERKGWGWGEKLKHKIADIHKTSYNTDPRVDGSFHPRTGRKLQDTQTDEKVWRDK